MLWMKKNAYEDSTIKTTAKILRHLQRNCNTADPEAVKLFIANKTCGNGRKQNCVEAYDKYIKSEGLTWEQPFYKRYDKKRRAPKEKLVDLRMLNVYYHILYIGFFINFRADLSICLVGKLSKKADMFS